ncbi:hypothetical protein [Intrasporangium flavum]|uniref:hypothetical protein n=1 Tax=Intrasporangium flavum TaxID=1428657 RepID=UPI00096F7447|nr:hypothetical protein [Intrasporangium flavum]
MKLRSRAHRLQALGAAATLAGGLAVVAAPSAQAVDCSTAWQDLSSGYNSLNQGAPVKAGPHAECATRYTQSGTASSVQLHCWTKNTAGNIWWHVRHQGTGTNGWVYEGNLYYSIVRNDGNRCKA